MKDIERERHKDNEQIRAMAASGSTVNGKDDSVGPSVVGQPGMGWTGDQVCKDTSEALRLDASYRNLDRVIAWTANADNKAMIALAFQGAILAALASVADHIRDVFARGWGSILGWILLVAAFAFVASFGVSLYKLFCTIHPDTTSHETEAEQGSPFFFGAIAGMPPDTFAERMKSLDAGRIEDELIAQAHAISGIAHRKFARLKVANWCLLVELGVLLVAVVIAALM